MNKRAVVHCIDKLLLDRLDVLEEGLVVLDLLVEHGGRLLVQLAGDVVTIDEALALVQPLTNLTKLSRKPSVKKPLPMANLILLSVSLLFIIIVITINIIISHYHVPEPQPSASWCRALSRRQG